MRSHQTRGMVGDVCGGRVIESEKAEGRPDGRRSLQTGCQRRGVKDDSEVFYLCNQENGAAISRDGEDWG